MKASPFSQLFLMTALLVLALTAFAQSGAYTVQVDSLTSQETAESKVQQLKAQSLNAYWLKSNVPGQGLRYRVRIGRFANRAAAQSYGTRLKQQGLVSDFYVALYEGSSSPLAAAEPRKAPAPVNTPKSVMEPAPKAEPAAATTSTPKPALPATNSITPSDRPRETKSAVPVVTPTSTVEQPAANDPAVESPAKPVNVIPTAAPPTNNAAPKSVPVKPVEARPNEAKPPILSPLDELKAPRDRKASNITDSPASSSSGSLSNMTAANTAIPVEVGAGATAPAPGKKPEAALAAMSAPTTAAAGFQRFEESTYGFSFEHPIYWSGGKLSVEDIQAQRIDAGVVFRSQEEVAFMNAIWNSLKNANSPAYDNNLIVDLVIKSLSSGNGLQGLSEIARRTVQDSNQIKTFVDLRTLFRQPRASVPLEFQGKAVIIRANTGILLVVAFYSKDSAQSMAAAAEKIINSARVP